MSNEGRAMRLGSKGCENLPCVVAVPLPRGGGMATELAVPEKGCLQARPQRAGASSRGSDCDGCGGSAGCHRNSTGGKARVGRARHTRKTTRSIVLSALVVAACCACLAHQVRPTTAVSTASLGAQGSTQSRELQTTRRKPRRGHGRSQGKGNNGKGGSTRPSANKQKQQKRRSGWDFAHVQEPDPDTDLLVIVSQPRSGTTWVNDLLTAHPCVVSIGELHSAYAYHISKDTTPHPDATREKMLWTMFTPSSTTKAFDNCKKRYIIRKLFIQSQLEFPPQSESGMNFMFDWFRSRGLKMLWLQRWNQLDRAISGRSINHGSAIHCKSNTGCANRAFALDLPGSIDKIVKSQRNLDHFSEPFRAKAREYNISVLEMQYERIKEWPQNRVSQTLFEFMGIDDTAPERHEDSDFQKRVTKTHAQMVKNLGAVCSRLKGKGLDCFCLDKMPAGGKLAGCM